MFPLFLALTILSGIALAAGAIMLLVRRGDVSKTTATGVGADIMGDDDEPSDLTELTVAEKELSFFKGKSVAVGVSGELSLTEAKQAWRERRWDVVLNAALLVFGFGGLFLFGALSIFTGLESKLPGILALAAAAYVLYILIRDLIKS